MNRHELATLVKNKVNIKGLSTKDIEKIFRAAEQLLYDTIMQGGRVVLLGFGTFLLKTTDAHQKISCLFNKKRVINVPITKRVIFKTAHKKIQKIGEQKPRHMEQIM